jgi:hypothetical protein
MGGERLLLTYGGFLLLCGRAADLLGRRLLVTGTALFGLSSASTAMARKRAGSLRRSPD